MRYLTLLTLATFAVATAHAQPDAGSLLRDELRRDASPIVPTPLVKPKVVEPIEPTQEEGPSTPIIAFRIVGLTAVPETEAQAFFVPFLNKRHTLEALHRIAQQFERWLRERGLFVARAWIPPQALKDGMVEIRVLEGRVEGVDIRRATEMRLDEASMRQVLIGALPEGAAIEQSRLERGLLLLNDLPAVSARAVLTPGKETGASRVLIEAAQGPVIAGSVELDNTGNRFTGEARLSGALTLNDPLGLGDQWSLRATHTQGSEFVRAGWTMPVGADGWKAGITLIGSTYALCCEPSISALNSSGEAAAVSAFASYPLVRSRLTNLSVSASTARRDFKNRSLGATTSDKTIDALALGVSGDWSDMAGLGAYYAWSLQMTSGKLDLSGLTSDKDQDATTAKSHGSYQKFTGHISRLQRVSDSSALYASLSGQLSGKNLDSSEKFTLGGAQGVRAYPSGEASGDAGWLFSAEWRHEINSQWRGTLFADHGEVKLHHDIWDNWNAATPNTPNRYALSGAGASLAFAPTSNSQITATVASRLGSNPARDATDRDSDNRPARVQLWLQGNMAF